MSSVLLRAAKSIVTIFPKEKVYTWYEASYNLEHNEDAEKESVDACGYLYNAYLGIREFARLNAVTLDRKRPPKSAQIKIKFFFLTRHINFNLK